MDKVVKISEKLLKIAEELLEDIIFEELEKKAKPVSSIKEWLKRKGKHSLIIPLDILKVSVTPPVFELMVEEDPLKEAVGVVPARLIIQKLKNEKKPGITIKYDGSYFIIEGNEITENKGFPIPPLFFLACVPYKEGSEGVGAYIEGNQLIVDYLVFPSDLDSCKRIISAYPDINNIVLFIKDGIPKFISREEFLK